MKKKHTCTVCFFPCIQLALINFALPFESKLRQVEKKEKNTSDPESLSFSNLQENVTLYFHPKQIHET